MMITDRARSDVGYQDKYAKKMNQLNDEKQAWQNIAKQTTDSANSTKKKTKKKKGKDVMVTAATKKDDIRKFIATLNQKISEVQAGDEDMKLKNVKINALQMKIAALERLLTKVAQQERGQDDDTVKHKKEKAKDKVFLTKDDLTVEEKKSGAGLTDAQTQAGAPSQIDVTADFKDVPASAGETPTVDIGV